MPVYAGRISLAKQTAMTTMKGRFEARTVLSWSSRRSQGFGQASSFSAIDEENSHSGLAI